jgi:hypothetical protein
VPPRLYNLKVCISFIKCFGIIVIVANFHVLCPQMHSNEHIGMDIHGLNSMEKN